jgi:hypothetical protein
LHLKVHFIHHGTAEGVKVRRVQAVTWRTYFAGSRRLPRLGH